ncbi:MAG: MarR family transcriptional regulator [Nibricoccus sp.]
MKTLLRIARQSDEADEARCALLLSLVTTGRAMRNELQRFLTTQGLSDLKFCALIVLHALDPEPSTPADIAHHTDVTRSAITDVLDQLEKRRWISRRRDRADRRIIYVHLTATGREELGRLIPLFLKFISDLALDVDPAERGAVTSACVKLQQRAHPSAR